MGQGMELSPWLDFLDFPDCWTWEPLGWLGNSL